MNFFGHAVLALARRDDAAFVVGSMAPDFATMSGVRLAREVAHPELAAGVRFHHRSDDAFHGAPGFVELMSAARKDLAQRGLGPGPSLAIGHVGVELLLDGQLALRPGVPAAYRAALAQAAALGEHLSFRGGDPDQGAARWQEVPRRLLEAPVPEAYRDPELVGDRLVRILASRPRLRVEPGNEPHVVAWARAFLPRVAAAADALLDEVEARLAE